MRQVTHMVKGAHTVLKLSNTYTVNGAPTVLKPSYLVPLKRKIRG